jgi:hypothetical protein
VRILESGGSGIEPTADRGNIIHKKNDGGYQMPKILIAIVLVVVTLMTSCTKNEEKEWKETALINLTTENDMGEQITAKWLGEEGRIAISDSPFISGKGQKYMWLLWGNQNELVGKAFKVTAISEKGQEKTVVESVLGGTNWGATASSPSTVALPVKGLRKLNAYVADKLHGTLIVKVQ